MDNPSPARSFFRKQAELAAAFTFAAVIVFEMMLGVLTLARSWDVGPLMLLILTPASLAAIGVYVLVRKL